MIGGDVVIIPGNLAELTGISQRFIDELLAHCSSNSLIKKVVLFGSRARGDFHLRSDIDLAIYTNNVTHTQQNLIEFTIQEMLTHLKIDIIFTDRLTKNALIDNIKRDGVIVYEQGKAIREA
ncbi:nucleotidyltransferase family protein [Lentibacillus sp. Marseille-P4043]|uniref:nucleotidyltransferase family protein n=1 Tax=Lentibacillus sp. Marseille-P4043 TaxID=2040293 RepID=UPI00131A560D|nr:nucleotidyltransferase domain-containing protein [Lentibacillus sp. Marseille-P4043]